MTESELLFERANKYLKSAKLLYESGDYESTVSRVYYDLFFTVEALLLTKNMTFSSHKGVLSAFGAQFIKTGLLPQKMSKELNRAFEKRQLGDYDYTFVITKEEALEILQNGESFVEEIIRFIDK